MKNFTYPAIFSYNNNEEIEVNFLDLNITTKEKDIESAILLAQQMLELELLKIEKENRDFPTPTLISDVSLKDNEMVIPINPWYIKQNYYFLTKEGNSQEIPIIKSTNSLKLHLILGEK